MSWRVSNVSFGRFGTQIHPEVIAQLRVLVVQEAAKLCILLQQLGVLSLGSSEVLQLLSFELG